MIPYNKPINTMLITKALRGNKSVNFLAYMMQNL